MTEVFSVQVQGMSAALTGLDAAGRAARLGAEEGLTILGEIIMGEAKELAPVDLGTLRNSGYVLGPTATRMGGHAAQPGAEAATIVADALFGVNVVVGFGGPAAPYALVMHEGRMPGSTPPPIEAIKAWARRKGIDENLAYPIARSIGKKGTKPLKYLETPAKAHAGEVAPMVAKAIARRLEGLHGPA